MIKINKREKIVSIGYIVLIITYFCLFLIPTTGTWRVDMGFGTLGGTGPSLISHIITNFISSLIALFLMCYIIYYISKGKRLRVLLLSSLMSIVIFIGIISTNVLLTREIELWIQSIANNATPGYIETIIYQDTWLIYLIPAIILGIAIIAYNCVFLLYLEDIREEKKEPIQKLSSLARICTSCGVDVRDQTTRFCSQCGHAL